MGIWKRSQRISRNWILGMDVRLCCKLWGFRVITTHLSYRIDLVSLRNIKGYSPYCIHQSKESLKNKVFYYRQFTAVRIRKLIQYARTLKLSPWHVAYSSCFTWVRLPNGFRHEKYWHKYIMPLVTQQECVRILKSVRKLELNWFPKFPVY